MTDDRMTLNLFNPQQGYQELLRAWGLIKSMLFAGHRLVLEVRPATRSLDQNAKFHAICGDLAKSGLPWAGKTRNAKQWKVLLVSGHATATEEGSEIVPGLEGEFVNIRESTALMSVRRSSSLIEYAISFCVMNNVKLSAKSMADADTGEIHPNAATAAST
jgi:hypothetical protein